MLELDTDATGAPQRRGWPRRPFALTLTLTLTLTFAAGLIPASASLAQTAPPAPPAAAKGSATPAGEEPTLLRAQALFAQGKAAEAAKIARAVVEKEPHNARALLLLGAALQKAGDLEGALAADRKAATFEATKLPATYNTACVLALQGKKDAALAELAKLAATGSFDLTQIAVDPDLRSLADDPRFAALLPSATELAHPFAEKVEILHEWDGEAAGDQFGWIARNVGDVDGDGVADLVASAPSKEVGGAAAGRVYVYSGKSGKLLWSASGAPGDRLGFSVEAAGDTNRDGVPDVIAGAPGAGEARVYSGRDGRVLLTLRGEKDGLFGRQVSDVGDQNGDGYADFVVGAPGPPGGPAAGKLAGRAIVYSGRGGKPLLELHGEGPGDGFGSALAGGVAGEHHLLVVGAPGAGPEHRGRVYVYTGLVDKPTFVLDADPSGSRFGGMFSSLLGDVDGDSVPDIYASDWADGAKGRLTGRVYVASGKTGKILLDLTGEAAGDGFGIGRADAGDVDGDGVPDLVVGAWQQSALAPKAGKVYVFSGKDGRLLRQITGRVPGETFGFDATGMGDVNGDGVPDLLLTSAWSTVHGARSGRMFLIAGERPGTTGGEAKTATPAP